MFCGRTLKVGDRLDVACPDCGHLNYAHLPDGCELCRLIDRVEVLSERFDALERKVAGIQEINGLWDGS